MPHHVCRSKQSNLPRIPPLYRLYIWEEIKIFLVSSITFVAFTKSNSTLHQNLNCAFPHFYPKKVCLFVQNGGFIVKICNVHNTERFGKCLGFIYLWCTDTAIGDVTPKFFFEGFLLGLHFDLDGLSYLTEHPCLSPWTHLAVSLMFPNDQCRAVGRCAFLFINLAISGAST